MKITKKRHAIATLIILIITLLFFSNLFFPEPKIFYTPEFGKGDIWYFNYPFKDLLSESLKSGELPFWSKYIGTGFPVFAEGQIGALYLPNLILFGLLPTWLAWNLSYVFIFSTTFLGTYLFLYKKGVSWISSLFSAFVFSFGGYFITHIIHLNYIQSASWLPWIFLTGEQLWKKPSGKHASLLAIVLSLQIFAGSLQYAFISLLGFYIYIALQNKKQTKQEMFTKTLILTATVFLALAIASAQILPSLELTNLSERKHGLPLNQTLTFPYPPQHLITFLTPNFFGNPKNGNYSPPSENWGLFWENTSYIGVLPLLLAAISLKKRRKKPWKKAFWIMMLVSLLLSLGKYSPLALIFHLPLFNMFRVPSRFLILTTFTLSGLAGVGIDHIRNLLLQNKVSIQLRTSIPILIIVLVVVDLLKFTYSYHPLVRVKDALKIPETMSFLTSNQRVYSTPDRPDTWNNTFINQGWQEIKPYLHFKNDLEENLNIVFDVPQVEVYSGMMPKRLHMYLWLMNQNFPRNTKLLNASSAKFIISPKPIQENKHLALVAKTETPKESLPTYYVYKNNQALDRFRFASKYKIAPSIQKIEKLIEDQSFSFKETVILETDPQQVFQKLQVEEIIVIKDTNQKILLKTNTDKKTILVIADTYYPGWRASINGQQTKILPANLNQRAIIIPPGKNEVKLRYFPKFFYIGALLSITSIIGIVLLLNKNSLFKKPQK